LLSGSGHLSVSAELTSLRLAVARGCSPDAAETSRARKSNDATRPRRFIALSATLTPCEFTGAFASLQAMDVSYPHSGKIGTVGRLANHVPAV
jgi:hypothetical protein